MKGRINFKMGNAAGSLPYIAVACAGYIGVSVAALKYPMLVPCRKKRLVRLGAARCGTDMIELDCQITKDNIVVVAHDDHLLRVAGISERIKNLNFEDLPRIKKSLLLDFDQSFEMTNDDDPAIADTKIPKLSQVFDEFPNILINIDVKMKDPVLLEKVSELIHEYERTNTVAWGNFRHSVTEACYRRHPEIPLIFSSRRVLVLLFLFYTGLLPFFPIKESCLEILMPSILIDLLMSRHLFEHLRARGVNIYCWVLNSEQEFDRALELGATGVMTDFPSKLRRFLDERGES